MASKRVTRTVSEHSVVIYSKSYCPFCSRVKALLAGLGVKAQITELDLDSEGSAVQDELTSRTGQTTVPSVWVGGRFIGGCDDAYALHAQGQLKPKLFAAGAI